MKNFLFLFTIALFSGMGYAESVADVGDGIIQTENVVIDVGPAVSADYAINVLADQPAEVFVNQKSKAYLFLATLEQTSMPMLSVQPVVNDVGKHNSDLNSTYPKTSTVANRKLPVSLETSTGTFVLEPRIR